MPVPALVRRLRRRGDRPPRRSFAAAGWPPGASPAATRSAPPVTTPCRAVNGTTRSPRHLPLLPGAVRLAGAVRQAGAEAAPGSARQPRDADRKRRSRAAPAAARRPPTATPAPAAQPRAAAPAVSAARRRDRPSATSASRPRDVIAVFTNRGARLKSWRLKHYLDQQGQPLELVDEPARAAAAAVLAAHAGRRADGDAERRALHRERRAAGAGESTSPVDLRFEYRDSAGLHAVKEFHLDPASYVVTFRATVTRGRSRAAAGDRVGPGARRHRRETSRYVKKPEALAVRERQGRPRSRRATSRSSRRTTATSSTPASTTTTS